MKRSSSRTMVVVAFVLLALLTVSCGAAATPANTSAPAANTPVAAATQGAAPQGPAGNILFHSSQFSPVNEAELMRNTILKDFNGKVDFQPQAAGPFVDIPLAQAKAGKMQLDV